MLSSVDYDESPVQQKYIPKIIEDPIIENPNLESKWEENEQLNAMQFQSIDLVGESMALRPPLPI